MIAVDATTTRRRLSLRAEVAVVGSGPAGAAVARELAARGADVLVLEEGRHWPPGTLPADGFGAMAAAYRDLGGTLTIGRAPMPLVQGRAVGGTSVVNGAISWRLPDHVLDAWLRADPGLGATLSKSDLDARFAALEEELHIAPTDPDVAGPKNRLMAAGATALGLAHRPISRNVRGCRGLGRCLQGCPEGHKMSMDLTLLPDAVRHGARIAQGVVIDTVTTRRGRVTGLRGHTVAGGVVTVEAPTVALAASAVGTPALLLRSGLGQREVGRGFQCHPGVAVAGTFREPVRMWSGATQGHEVIGLVHEGLKFEVLGYDQALVALRQQGIGRALADRIDHMAHQAHWGAAIKATTRGRLRVTPAGPAVTWNLVPDDVRRVRRGVAVLGALLFAAGAEQVEPGVKGWDEVVTDPRRMAAIEHEGPLDATAYSVAATHLFGTCRMGSDEAAPVDPSFRLRGTDGLFVVDSSVFPTNTGVNPQTSILALATVAARSVLAR